MLKKFTVLLVSIQIVSAQVCYAKVTDRASCLKACDAFNGTMALCCYNCCYNNYEIGKESEEVK